MDTLEVESRTETKQAITPQVPLYKRLHKLEKKTYLKLAIAFLLLCVVVLAIVFNRLTAKAATWFLKWMEKNPEGGAFLFIGVYFFATILFIPGLILTVGAGFVFSQVLNQWLGVLVATIVVFTGACLGASAAFLIGRFVLRESITEYAKKFEKFELIDKVVEINGLKVTFLLRLAPIIPFNAFNYFMGLTSVQFKQYCMAHVGMLPGTLAYCFLGSTLSAVSDAGGAGFGDNIVVLIVFIVCLVLAFVGMGYIGYVAKKEFARLAAQVQEKEERDAVAVDVDEIEEVPDSTHNLM